MRESKGKVVNSNKWIVGYYVFGNGQHYILEKHNNHIGYDGENYDWTEVEEDSVVSFTEKYIKILEA